MIRNYSLNPLSISKIKFRDLLLRISKQTKALYNNR
jgi:hypothetical protein